MKLYSPQDLADNSMWSLNYIQSHAEMLGFAKLEDGSRRWFATQESFDKAIERCFTNSQHRSIGTSNSNTVEKPLGDLLVKQINAMPNGSRSNCD